MALLLKHDPAGWNPLDPCEPDPLPAVWNGPHVGLRLCEGFRTLRLLPMTGYGQALKSYWPAVRVEFEDLPGAAGKR